MTMLDHQPIDAKWIVQPQQACPGCGEKRMRILRWIQQYTRVRCRKCKTVYVPPARVKLCTD